LFLLWNQLQHLETLAKSAFKNPRNVTAIEKYSAILKDAAQKISPSVVILCQKVDKALEKLNPLGSG
jgi:hypothetical protein